jgi:uncharacterized protein with HEPN domain
MPPRQVAYLLDIFQSVKVIQQYIAGLTHEQFSKDTKTQDAVLRRFLVAGEAAARLTPETCAEFPDVPFRKITGMRNRVVHDYGNVDFEIVWETIQNHLLIRGVAPLLCRAGRSVKDSPQTTWSVKPDAESG